MRALLAVVFSLSFVACYGQDSQTSRLQDDAANTPYIEDCQSLLSPSGAIENDTYSMAIFTQRACRGKGKAVTKIAAAKEVIVVDGSGSIRLSRLYADGMEVLVEGATGRVAIGLLQDTNEGLELVLSVGVEVELKVGSAMDDLVTWQPGDLAPYRVEAIYVFI